jgi:hypothetical protein
VKRAQERLGLLEGGVVTTVLDHVQRPAMLCAGTLGDAQPRLEVVPSVDQGRRNFDPCKVGLRNAPGAELRHEAAKRGPCGLRACPRK